METTQQKQLQSGNHTRHNNSRVLPLRTEDLNSETLATYFQELNFNIIKYCEETYPVQSQYSIDFELETETSNKDKQKLKQYSKTTPNTPILPKTTAKHLQTPKQGTSSKLLLTITSFLASLAQAQTLNSLLNRFARLEDFTSPRSPTRQQKPLQISSNLLDFLAENQSEHSETAANEENNSEISEKKSIDSENKEDEMTAYIAKISEFNREDIETSPQKWLDQVTKAGDANGWNAARMLRTILYFLKGTAETSESVMTYIGKFNKLFRQIRQLKTNDYYSDAQVLDQFIAGLKDKLIKKVHPHPSKDLNSAIQHAKRYEMTMEEANHTKLSKTISPTNNNSNPKDINHPKDEIKTASYHSLITSLRIAITVESLATGKEIAKSYNETNKTEPQYQTNYYQPALQPMQQQYRQLIQYYQVPAQRLVQQNQFASQNQFITNNNRINPNNQLVLRNPVQPRLSHYYTQLSYLTIPEEQNFYHPALSENRAAAQQQSLSYTSTTIPPARIAENANLSDIFPFEFKANDSPFLFSNAATNEQKAITVMYTEAEVKGMAIRLILDSRSAEASSPTN
ncbi:hypothetical protein G9A89_013663 [Geosiphon pyriformis]|nr:hypothetical protein G9A89_013663 [Geosiphon pyriformis]